jgi:hypothetical protein
MAFQLMPPWKNFITNGIFNGLPGLSLVASCCFIHLHGSEALQNNLAQRMGRSFQFYPIEARRGILTANATTPYYLGFADLSAGPFVFEMPAQGVQGGTSDAWQMNIPVQKHRASILYLDQVRKSRKHRRLHCTSVSYIQHLSWRSAHRC